MRLFGNSRRRSSFGAILISCAAASGTGLWAGENRAQPPDSGKVKQAAPLTEWGSKLPLAAPAPASSAPPKSLDADAPNPPPLAIPLTQGYDTFGLTIPDLDKDGRLRSQFVIGAISRVDDATVEIRDSFLETYREDGSPDLSIELPKAILNRFTRVLVAKTPVVIRRQEFEVTGASLEFNTNTRDGGLGGPVQMTIYNGSGTLAPQPPPKEPKHPRETQKAGGSGGESSQPKK